MFQHVQNIFRKGKRNKIKLEKNIRYTISKYKYGTDSTGRIDSVHGNLHLGKAKRNQYAQRSVGGEYRRKDDDGGHMIGTQFDGSGQIDNLVPMNSQINRSGGRLFRMETKWANALKNGKLVSVYIHIEYSKNLDKKKKT